MKCPKCHTELPEEKEPTLSKIEKLSREGLGQFVIINKINEIIDKVNLLDK